MCKTLVCNSSRVEYYSIFKTEFKLENYLLRLNAVHRNYICKLRTSKKKFKLRLRIFCEMNIYVVFDVKIMF